VFRRRQEEENDPEIVRLRMLEEMNTESNNKKISYKEFDDRRKKLEHVSLKLDYELKRKEHFEECISTVSQQITLKDSYKRDILNKLNICGVDEKLR